MLTGVRLLKCIDTKITEEQNSELLMQVMEDDVRSALFQMDPDKAPGPDGMTPAFYQKHWAIVGHDVVELVRMFMQKWMMPEGLNDTNVVLIPKKKCPTTVGDLRAISLCNVLVKIITKVMANRMKNMLDGVMIKNLFSNADDSDALNLMELLQVFEEASGQKVNLMKSSVVCSSNVTRSCRDRVCQVREADDNVTYLGLPNMVGRNKSRVIGFLQDKMRNRVQSWKEGWVSQAGKEILIRNMVQGTNDVFWQQRLEVVGGLMSYIETKALVVIIRSVGIIEGGLYLMQVMPILQAGCRQCLIKQKRDVVDVIQGDGVDSWVKPKKDEVKVMVDVAIFKEQNRYGVGMLARDDERAVVQGRSDSYEGVVRPEFAEAMSVKEALSWVKCMAWQGVTIESDCLGVVQAIRSKVTMTSPFSSIIMECRRLIAELNIELFFIKRSANMAAHLLARESCLYPGRVFDRRNVPIGLMNIVSADLFE
ncbi:hypothetical protein AgCh_016602 [Apium graveolens]